MDRITARARNSIVGAIRRFFDARGYTEVETPILAPGLIPESSIEAFRTSFVGEHDRDLFLLPSPELWMKRLIGLGWGPIFQISKAFRNAESIGRLHNPEFTMLEWYTPAADYMDSLALTESLLAELIDLRCVRERLSDEERRRLAPPCLRLTVAEAFREWAGLDLEKLQDEEELRAAVERLGLRTSAADDWEILYNRIFVDRIEPRLSADRPTVLIDYPVQVACLAARTQTGPWRQRWELYLNGIETVNCFSEEISPEAVRELMRAEARATAAARVAIEVDEDFPSIYESPYPACSGAALGVDRLVMALLNIRTIEGVILFPFSDILPRERGNR